MTRKERIYLTLIKYEQMGIIRDFLVHGDSPGLRWVFTPHGHSERALTTSGIEDFILGVNSALDWKDHQHA